ncbi:CDP-diacylglycerol--glycerol-3-phosphate 3-phosphatidyltransferase [Paracoccus aestuarii]|uniref:CDP-diacylglycerol--glycerol-3-phosphate 3-phosphatidyltransferase n=1 Tax=Paracoccus aestuarii TaxID=453842 RepID=A0A419A2A2_9RHOB|nr:CDP-diacylglycerol--glycerol-3-phosphate 3-phosphatidyltransferase [Paracoccus aestuarii]RJL07163.1 CDP-diacylglycerol--glycerol-3-phosphate 3-phosphatidyltransferase [Paracoccus aestuarii]WCQ99577.1 CDP-diacylglycerol--glycerol-3-phosphate 3-phosphatidyltransferase [Paracoccus aestuarii]
MRWTLPNILTLLRLLAAPGVPLMFLYFQRPWADWAALTLFLLAAVTDWFDGYLARAWKQESRFGAAMDPIADKAMVVIALVVITGYSGMNPWLILPVTVILFREVFVSGLREFLGDKARLLAVTRMAKWKTTLQMVAISVLFLSTGLAFVEHGRPPRVGEAGLIWSGSLAAWATYAGLVLIWAAAVLTAWTGWDYFVKAMPHLRDNRRDA